MKTLIICLMACLLFTACARPKEICGRTFDTFGLADYQEKTNKKVLYRISWLNVILGVVLFETIIVPIYVFGFNTFEPVGIASSEPGTREEETETTCKRFQKGE